MSHPYGTYWCFIGVDSIVFVLYCTQGIDDMTRARDGMQRTPLMSGIGGAIFANDLTRAEISTAAHTLQCIHADR